MLNSTKLYLSVFLLFLATLAVPAARADSVTYGFSYSGTGVGLATAQGTGKFSYDTITRDVTAFTFRDSFTNFLGQKAGTFVYTLADISYQGMLLFADGTLRGLDITTGYKNANSGSYGQANFSFNYGLGMNVDATTGSRPGENTIGSGTVRLLSIVPAATPEPSSLMLLGTGILAAAGVARKKIRT